VDQGSELLTGLPAGVRDAKGKYPKGTVNRMVEDRLGEIAKKRQALERKGRANSTTGDKKDGGEEAAGQKQP
jgi:hypothetical protein